MHITRYRSNRNVFGEGKSCAHIVIIWTNAGILIIETLWTNFSEILSKIHIFSFGKRHLKITSAKWRLFHLGLNELSQHGQVWLGVEFLTWNNYDPVNWPLYTSSVLRVSINTLRPRQNARHFADDIFKCSFVKENVWISIEIPLKFMVGVVLKCPIDNISALFQIKGLSPTRR